MTPATNKENQSLDQHVQDVDDCPRCGGQHERVIFRRLKHPARMGSGLFEFWAPCPTTSEPMLLEVPEVVPP